MNTTNLATVPDMEKGRFSVAWDVQFTEIGPKRFVLYERQKTVSPAKKIERRSHTHHGKENCIMSQNSKRVQGPLVQIVASSTWKTFAHLRVSVAWIHTKTQEVEKENHRFTKGQWLHLILKVTFACNSGCLSLKFYVYSPFSLCRCRPVPTTEGMKNHQSKSAAVQELHPENATGMLRLHWRTIPKLQRALVRDVGSHKFT